MHTHFHFVLVYLPAPPDSEGGLKSRGSTGGIALERAASDRTDISAPVLAASRLVCDIVREVAHFDQTGPGGARQISRVVESSGGIKAVPKNDKHKEYASYEEHCLRMAPVAPDQEFRVV